jgi:hypothetical protein
VPVSLSSLSTVSSVRIVEVGPRDGLQNEQHSLPTEVKAMRWPMEFGLW